MKICNNCKKRVEDYLDVCPYCGRIMYGNELIEVRNGKRNTNKVKKLIIVTIGSLFALVFAIILPFIFLAFEEEEEVQSTIEILPTIEPSNVYEEQLIEEDDVYRVLCLGNEEFDSGTLFPSKLLRIQNKMDQPIHLAIEIAYVGSKVMDQGLNPNPESSLYFTDANEQWAMYGLDIEAYSEIETHLIYAITGKEQASLEEFKDVEVYLSITDTNGLLIEYSYLYIN